jgi:hypothetical protein
MSKRFPDPDDLCDHCHCPRLEHTGLDVDDGEILSETCCTHPDHDCLEFEFDLGVTKSMVNAVIDASKHSAEIGRREIDLSHDDWYDLVATVLQAKRDADDADAPLPFQGMPTSVVWEGTITGRITMHGPPPWQEIDQPVKQIEVTMNPNQGHRNDRAGRPIHTCGDRPPTLPCRACQR